MTLSSTTSSTTSSASSGTSADHDPYLRHLAHLIAEHGIAAFESDIARLVVRLRANGLSGHLTELLADRRAPSVARERAFGHLIGLLARGRPPQRIPTAA